MKHIFVFRHGRTDWNAQNRMQGQSDTSLNAQGIAQAQVLGKALQPMGITLIASSDLMRARQTAETVASYCHAPVIFTPALREIHAGSMEGVSLNIFIQNPLLGNMYNMSPAYDNVGFPGGERKDQVRERAVHYTRSLADSTEHTYVGISAHDLVIRVMIHALTGAAIHLENAQYAHLAYDPTTQRWELLSGGDYEEQPVNDEAC